MYVRRNYSFWMTFMWSRKSFIYGTLYALVVVLIYEYIDIKFALPWQPISVIGLAVAFYLGFKNNSSYDRTWEARKIWGAIVNDSRTFATAVLTFVECSDPVQLKAIQKDLIYRHIAWLTALRYQLRLSREWEHQRERLSELFNPNISEVYFEALDRELLQFLPEEEINGYFKKSNTATHMLNTQAAKLREMYDAGMLSDYRWMQLHGIVGAFYDGQGASERIKNFPFPRQYASTALWMTMVFCALLPFGLLSIFEEHDYQGTWFAILFSGLITWVFFLMEKIGDFSENPFEGTYNDVPISSIARTIEIDLRQMINDDNIPAPLAVENGFLM